MQRIEHFIAGEARVSAHEAWLDVIEPATNCVIAHVARGLAKDVEAAVDAARIAAPRWAATSVRERARVLHAMADGIEAQAEAFARAESIDSGKPLSLARTIDIPRAIANVRWFADAAMEACHTTERFDSSRATNEVLRMPVGVVGAISPWNLPLYLLTWKIAAPLAMGNAVVAKPSELTPTTASMLAGVAGEVGLPPGVLNIVHGLGPEAGAALVEHPDVRAITFTGGTTTGRSVNQACAASFKKVSLELGGKNAMIVFADADIDAAIDTATAAAFANQGQICLCTERLLIEASVYDRVLKGVIERARAIRIGDPLDAETDYGSLISRAHRDSVETAIAGALADGAQVCTGGQRPADLPDRVSSGAFFEPTVLQGIGMNARFNREEVFGPVVCAMPFTDEAEAVQMANATDYGLCATVCTQDLDRAARVARNLDVGTVWTNCWLVRDFRVPFGGVKYSGLGREGGDDALHFCTEARTICTASSGTVDASGAVPSGTTP